MRLKFSFAFMIASLFFLSVSAQKKIKYSSINMGGVAVGESESAGLIQTINGVNFKKSFAGLGIGIDYYKNKTIPFFIDLRTSVAKTNVFVFADGGYNFPNKNKPDDKISYYNSYHFTGGFYSELGIGYKIKLYRKISLLFTSGYSYKELNNKILPQCADASCLANYDTYHYAYSRVQFKAGVSF